ncbi:MAG: DUF3450 domain-containing protein [Xanthomonadales bacterium]|jgi:hypothetical protein|nr:DUF3450 domain-containing protein [Xanthomonadales bacterium]
MAETLIALRAEVEQLNAELTLVRDESKTELLGLNAQRAELAAQIERQQLALKKLAEDLAQRQEAAAKAGVGDEQLTPVLLATLEGLSAQVQAGLPFRTDERLAALTELRTQIESKALPPSRAANRLWAFIEDEYRLSRENSLQKQTITLNGQPMLADVARIGSMMLFFRLDDGTVGSAVPGATGWSFEAAREELDRKRITVLFEALSKQIRQGWFELPNALIGGAP